MKIVIGSDKAGYSLKEAIKKYLIELKYEICDVGTQDMEHGVPYPEVASKAAELIQQNKYDRGILCCGTGMGMAIVANKYKNVYAAVVESAYAAKKARVINNANILTMGGWIVAPKLGTEMVDTFLNTEFTEGTEKGLGEFLKGGYKQIREIEEKLYK